ncbi:MAG: ABC transporter ATP-binding protein [Clostridia bacterium]|nr:ABC transporter ATP-binding protein [Clostridia bacterium]
MDSLLTVKNLSVDFRTDQGTVHAVRGISFDVKSGEILGIVGESGSGKSVTMYSIMGLLTDNAEIRCDQLEFQGVDINPTHFEDKKGYLAAMKKLRGCSMSMIFQDPMTFLNPTMRIGKQLCEPILNHTNLTKQQAMQRALELMALVGIPSPETRIRQYPFEFSGGMRQRIIIAIAMANNPLLMIADEPTTALDVTIQAQVLELIRTVSKRMQSSVILITHDLGVVASLCDRIHIMYGGKIVETGTDQEIFYSPNHPYTAGLLSCIFDPREEHSELTPIQGSPPDLLSPPAGCPFVDRCEKAMKICKLKMPEYTQLSPTHSSACWLNELAKGGSEG